MLTTRRRSSHSIVLKTMPGSLAGNRAIDDNELRVLMRHIVNRLCIVHLKADDPVLREEIELHDRRLRNSLIAMRGSAVQVYPYPNGNVDEPVKLFVFNPNSSTAMTSLIRRSAEAAASSGTTLEVACGGADAPPSIEGHADEAAAVPGMLEAIRAAETRGAVGHVIACFDDPGLGAAREVAAGPVVGIAQAGMQVAMSLATRFSVVTTLPRSVPIIEDLVARYGAGHACRRVRAVDLPVLGLEADPETALRRLRAETLRARDEDGAEAVLLGCAGMSAMCARLTEETGLPVIDGVHAAVRLAEALAGGGYRTAKTGAYAFPRDKSADLAAPVAALRPAE